MGRNNLGQFEKGTCGNPRGRRRKMPLRISDEQLREDFFNAAETLIPITEKGKRKLVPASHAIDMQLILKAASGDMKAIIEYNKRRERYTLEHLKLQLSNLEAIADAEYRIRKNPEDVTDEFKRVVTLLKASLDPYCRMP
ncbi:DUF5681 domain-containing protein [Bradyrhizobium sp. AZCC 2289]|uniref:DUF5681 domain-containing protein n=1 Tax=Bradyrhizobium sp. AZCC 2289 TaxID=3117026 RepID=UPI002FF0E75F